MKALHIQRSAIGSNKELNQVPASPIYIGPLMIHLRGNTLDERTQMLIFWIQQYHTMS